MHLKCRMAVTAVLLFLLLMLVSCSRKTPQAAVRSEVFYSYFDTVSEISSYAGDSEEAFRKNAASVSALLEHWHRMLDIYHEYDGMNNLCTVNMSAGGEPVPVDRDLIDFVLYAKDMCTLTSGEMDISLGAVLRLWHEARNAEASYLPSDEQLSDAYRHVGFDRLEIDT